jgi:Ca2+-binding RTX toxin-like protein
MQRQARQKLRSFVDSLRRTPGSRQFKARRSSRFFRCTAMEVLEERCLLSVVNWDAGGDGTSWEDPLNWDSDVLPSLADDVVINVPGEQIITFSSETQSVKSLQIAESFNLSGGTLSISESSIVTGDYLQSRGVLTGAGDLTLTANVSLSPQPSGITSIAGAGKLIIANTATVEIFDGVNLDRVLDNLGTVNYVGIGDLRAGPTFAPGTRIFNRAGAVFNVTAGGDFSPGSTTTKFLNEGTFNKTGSSATEFQKFSPQGQNRVFLFENNGTLNVSEGELIFSGGGNSTTVIDVPAAGTLTFNNTFAFAPPAILKGSGTFNFLLGAQDLSATQFLPTGAVNFSGGSVTIGNVIAPASFGDFRGVVTFNADQTLDTINALGTLGGSGVLTLTGTTNTISRTRFEGTGQLIIPGGNVLNIPFGSHMDRVLENFGTVNLGSGALSAGPTFAPGTRIFNRAGAVFNVTAGADFSPGSTTTKFLNEGTFNKTGSSATEFQKFSPQGQNRVFLFENNGTLNVSEGELIFSGGGNSTTVIDVPAAGTLTFNNTFAFAPPAILKGSGTFNFLLGVQDLSVTQFLPTGTVNFNRGTVTIGNTISPASFGDFRGVVTFNADQTLDSINALGTLGGTGDLTMAGTTTTVSGTRFEGTGKLIVPAGSMLDMPSGGTLNRILENFGTVNVGSGTIGVGPSFTGGERIFNRAGANFNVTDGGDFLAASAATVFINEGTFTKSGSSISTFLSVGSTRTLKFENPGLLRVLGGELRFNLPLEPITGVVELANGATWNVGGTVTIAGGTLTGTGQIIGNVNSSGIVRPGGPFGPLAIAGNFTQTTAGTLELQIGGRTAGSEHDELNVTGFAVMEGTLTIELVNGFTPAISDVFTLINFANTDGGFGTFNLPDISPLEFVVQAADATFGLSVQQKPNTGVTPTFRGTADPGSVVTITANTTQLGTATTDGNGDWSFTTLAGLSEGQYVVSVSGDGPARFNLTAPLGTGELAVPDLNGLALSDDEIQFFPFGDDLDGIIEPDDVIVAAEKSRLALPLDSFVASTIVGEVKRRRDGQLLLDQDTIADQVPDFRLLNETVVSPVGLASVLPFGLGRVEIRSIDFSSGFSAEFAAIGSFQSIDLSIPVSTSEETAKAQIKTFLADRTELTEADREIIAGFLEQWMLDPTDGVNAGLLPDGGIPATISDIEVLAAAQAAVAQAFRFGDFVRVLSLQDLFERDDDRGRAFADMLALRLAAPSIINNRAVVGSNGKSTPTAEDLQFVKAIISHASEAEAFGVDSKETAKSLAPSLQGHITRLQSEAASLAERLIADDLAVQRATALGENIVAASVNNTKAFIDSHVGKTTPGQANRLQFANTAVALAHSLVPESITADDPVYGPAAVTARIRTQISDFEFDPSNLLPAEPPPPDPFAPADKPRAFILLGDLPLDENGKLTTDSVTDLLRNVPAGVSRFVPLQSEFEFSFAVDNGTLKPLNLPTLTLGFDNLQLGKSVEAAGFISLGSYGAGGEFQKATFAGGLDIEAAVGGFESSLAVTINGTGDGQGFFPNADGKGGKIVADATFNLNLQSANDLPEFYLDVQNAEATFDMLVRIGDGFGFGFAFEKFDITQITVERFIAAFGGTAPGGGASSPIPNDALLTLTSEDVAINIADTDLPLISFGNLTARLPNAPGGLDARSAVVSGFSIDINDADNLGPAFEESFGFTLTGIQQLLNDLGVPDFIHVDSLGFATGPTFLNSDGTPGNLLDFSLLVSGGVDLPEPIAVPVDVDVRGMRINVGALSQGNLLDAVSFDEGLSVAIGPIDFGGALKIAGGFQLETIEFAKPNGETDKSILLQLSGDVELPGIAGIGANLVISELGPVAFGLSVSAGTEIPIGTTGVSIKKLGGRVVLNAPEIRDILKPLDLFAESTDPGIIDFGDLAGPLSLPQLKDRTRQLLEDNARQIADTGVPIETWFEPLLFAVDVDLGISGDPANTMLVETTIGARIDPGATALDLKIFGLGSITVMPDTPDAMTLGEAGVLLDFQGNDTTISLAFQTGGPELDIPATVAVGAQLLQKNNGQLFELRLEGEVTVDGLTGTDGSGNPTSIEAGGILVLEPGVGLYGAIQIDVGVNKPGDDLFLGGELFVRFNTDPLLPHALDPVVAQELVPRLVEDGQAVIPPGFGLFARVEFGLGTLLTASGTLEIESDPNGLRAALDLQGSMYNGAITAGIDGELLLANGSPRFRRLDVNAFIEAILVPDFLEAKGSGNLLITDAGLKNLSITADGIFFGLPFKNVGGNIDADGCVELTFGDGAVSFALPGGECGAAQSPNPTRLTIPNVSQPERDFLQTVDVPIQFVGGPNQITVAAGAEKGIYLEYWTVSRPDDSAVGFVSSGDYRKVERERVFVPGFDPVPLAGGVRLFTLPRTVNLPVEIFGDRFIETDETFSIFVQPVIPAGVSHPTLLRGDGFGRITIENDDVEVQPPSDAIIFFDFDRLTFVGPLNTPQFAFEPGPDADRSQFTFDLSAVSDISHTTDDVTALSGPRAGLSRLEDVSRAAVGETWLRPAVRDTANDRTVGALTGGFSGGTSPNLNVAGQREYFEFTVTTPRAGSQRGQTTTLLDVKGIDFWDMAEIGGTEWEVRYSLDGFATVLASAATHGGTFGNNQVDFRYPVGRSSLLPSGQAITFQISGPQQLTALDTDPLPWHVDNLALVGRKLNSVFQPPQPPVSNPPIPRTTRNRTTATTNTSGQPTTTRNQQRQAVQRATPPPGRLGRLTNGFVSEGTVFFDANGNGVIDFLDLNNNGTQDANEPNEPVAITDAGGLFEILISPEFDQDGNGQLDPSDGLLTSLGGIDQGTALGLSLQFTAPSDSISVTPLTTVISSLVTQAGLSVTDAHDLVRDGIVVNGHSLRASGDLFSDEPIDDINNGNALAIADYLAVVQVHDTALLFASSLATGGTSVVVAGNAAFDAIALELQQHGTLSLTDRVALRRIHNSAAASLGQTPADDLTAAVVDVVTSTNRALEVISEPAGLDLLIALKQTQRVVQSTTADEVQQAVDGTLPLSELRIRNTVSSLAARSAVEPVGTVFPIGVSIDNVAQAEPVSGTADFEFTISLSASSILPVSVDFETRGSTASALLGDFSTTAGTLTFAPGETQKTITVPVNADNVDELAEVFHVQLTNPVHALVQNVRGVGTIRMPSNTTLLPSEFSLGDAVSAIVGEPVEIDFGLPGIVSGLIDWGDSNVESVQLTAEADQVLIRGEHRYVTAGDYGVTLTLTNATGQIVVGRRSVTVENYLLLPDPNDPSMRVLSLNGTAGHDIVRLGWNASDNTLSAKVNRVVFGTFSASEVSRVTITTGRGHDAIIADPDLPVPLFIDSGDGNDLIAAGARDDVIVAGRGNDWIIARSGNDTVSAGAGADVVFGQAGDDAIDGDEGRDWILGGGGNDRIQGGSQNDLIGGGAGNDVIAGGNGNDHLQGNGGDDVLLGQSGNDRLTGGGGDDYVHGGAGNDSINGGSGDDGLYGGDGNDHVSGGRGDDVIDGGNDNDFVRGENGDDVISGGNGNDHLSDGKGDDIVSGNAGNDLIVDGGGNDVLVGGNGNDVVLGRRGRNIVIGGAGRDLLVSGRDQDVIIAGWTLYDDDPTALKLLNQEWRSYQSRTTRISNLRSGTGSVLSGTGIRLESGQSVFDDSDRDLIFADDDTDWLLFDHGLDRVR